METVILVVEDDKDINQMLKELLTSQGSQVVQAFSGTEALFFIEKQEVDAVIFDQMFTGISG